MVWVGRLPARNCDDSFEGLWLFHYRDHQPDFRLWVTFFSYSWTPNWPGVVYPNCPWSSGSRFLKLAAPYHDYLKRGSCTGAQHLGGLKIHLHVLRSAVSELLGMDQFASVAISSTTTTMTFNITPTG